MEDKDSKLDLLNALPSKDEAFGRATPWTDGKPVNKFNKKSNLLFNIVYF
jgi:hypothetical protein